MKKFFILFSLLAVVLTTGGFACTFNPFAGSTTQQLTQKVALQYWTVEQSSDNLKEVISAWNQIHPNITIQLKTFRPEEYEQKLLEGWAASKGPDLYSLPNTWLHKYEQFISPMPASLQLAFQEVQTTLGKQQIVTTVKTVPLLTAPQISRYYLQAVANDIVWNNKVYGLPISFDTLALLYNQKLLDAAGLAVPPATWTEVKDDVKKLTLTDSSNKINQAGIALGTAVNIPNAVDIATALMLQNGVTMANDQGSITINQPARVNNQNIYPALDAVNFYTDFADPLKETYSWNKDLPNASDLFIQGKLAMMIGYASQLNDLKQRAPKMDIKVAPLPQIAGAQTPLNTANYWAETVAQQSKNKDAAWGFIWFMSQSPQVEKILAHTNQAGALRSVIEAQKQSPTDVAIFAGQAINAKTWYHGVQPQQMEKILTDFITNLPTSNNPQQLLNQTAQLLNQTLTQPK